MGDDQGGGGEPAGFVALDAADDQQVLRPADSSLCRVKSSPAWAGHAKRRTIGAHMVRVSFFHGPSEKDVGAAGHRRSHASP